MSEDFYPILYLAYGIFALGLVSRSSNADVYEDRGMTYEQRVALTSSMDTTPTATTDAGTTTESTTTQDAQPTSKQNSVEGF